MAKNGWKLNKVAIIGNTPSLLAKNGRKWVLANKIWLTALSAAIVFRFTRFWPKKNGSSRFWPLPIFFAQRQGVRPNVLFICFCWLFFFFVLPWEGVMGEDSKLTSFVVFWTRIPARNTFPGNSRKKRRKKLVFWTMLYFCVALKRYYKFRDEKNDRRKYPNPIPARNIFPR